MEYLFPILAMYLLISFCAGMTLMIVDVASNFKFDWVERAVIVLYIPPVAVFGLGIVGAVLYAVWR